MAAFPSRPNALERAVDGVATPVFHGGRHVGEVRRFSYRVLYDAYRRRDRALASSPVGNGSPMRASDPA